VRQIVFALIGDRATCSLCVARQAGTSMTNVETALGTIGRIVTVHRALDRCRVCGIVGDVVSLEPLGV
jgi:hypothetical protein